MKSEKKKILSGKECEVMNYLPYFKEPPIDVMPRKRYIVFELSSLTLSLLFCKEHYFIRRVVADL